MYVQYLKKLASNQLVYVREHTDFKHPGKYKYQQL